MASDGASSTQQRIHFNLSSHEPETEFMFHVGLNDYPIRAHTENTLAESRETNHFLRHLPDHAITHFIDIDPPQYVSMAYTTKDVMVDGVPARQMTTLGIYIPKKTRMRDIDRGLRIGDTGLRSKFELHNIAENLSESQLADLENSPDDTSVYHDAYETSVALLFQHPELINLNKDAPKGGPLTVDQCIRKALDMKPYIWRQVIFKDHPTDWATTERVLDDDGKPAVDDQGKPIFTTGLHPDVREAMKAPMQLALQLAHQSEDLRGQTWTVQYGTTTAGYDGDVKPKKTLERLPLRSPADVRWRLKNLTPSSGLTFEPEIRFKPAPTGNVWRADGEWSSNPNPMVEPFDDAARQALADGTLRVVIDQISGPLKPDPKLSGHYTVELSSSTSTKKASGECWVRAEGGALQYTISTSNGPCENAYFAAGTPPKKVHSIALHDAGNCGEMTIVAKNHWLRHLSAYVEYLDASDRVQPPPHWVSQFPVPNTVFDQNDNKRFVAMVDPCETVMGIPLPADSTHLTIPVPQNAFKIRVSWGGLGSGEDDAVACPAGTAMTIIVEMAFPVMMLAIGAAITASGGLLKIVKEKPVYGALLVGAGVGYVAGEGWQERAWKLTKKLLPAIGKGLLGYGIQKYIAQKMGEGAAKRAIPFINLAMLAVDAAATVAQLAQTTAAVVQSPAVHVTEVTRTIGLQVVITSSKVYKKFPDHHHHLAVVIAYDSGATLPALIRELPNETISKDIVVLFEDVPASGNLRAMVFFYAENGWQSGQGATPWLKAEGTDGSTTLRTPPVEIDVNEIPLGEWSIYKHQEKIQIRDGKHVWQASEPPTAIKTTASPIAKLHAITVAQYSEMVGYSWQGTNLTLPPDDTRNPPVDSPLYALQNLSLLEDPERHYGAPKIAFTSPAGIAYDVVSPDDGSGRNFFIDPLGGIYDEKTNPRGGFHLRHINLDFKKRGVDFGITPASWGRFPDSVDAMVVHPHGYAFAIHRGTHKIYRLALPPAAVRDDKAPLSTMFSGFGKRHGLVNRPIGITLALDGRVLVLEAGNERVQCFDIHGNPVEYFTDPVTGQKSPVLDVSGAARRAPRITEYLDMAVEAKGHIFILCCESQGRKPSDYRVDLYDPSGKFLTTTPNFTAARLTVDLLRNLFALNYEVLQGKNGPEPGVSHWLPPAPPPTPPHHKGGN